METIRDIDSSQGFSENGFFQRSDGKEEPPALIPPTKPVDKIKKWLKKPLVIILVSVFLIVGAVYSGWTYFKGQKANGNFENQVIKKVKVVKIGLDSQNNQIKTVGTVKPETKVDVVSLGQGTIRGLFFNVGDKVEINQVLADIYGSTALTSFNNAQVNFFNLQNSLDTAVRITEESIRQAEIGVKNAEESVRLSEITLKNAQDSLENTKVKQAKNILDTQDNAIISFYSYLNTAKSVLDQINYILGVESGPRLSGISEVLAVKDLQSLDRAEDSYLAAKTKYNNLKEISSDRNTVINDIKGAIGLLVQAKQALDDAIIALDNSVYGVNFSESSLNTQKTTFTTYRSTVVTAQTGAKATLDSLENIDLANKTELDTAENAVKFAESQLQLAQVGLDNAQANLDSAIQIQQQQVISAQTSLDNAEGQLNLAGNQLSDLTIKAPIKGKVTGKYVELGAEISPGQKIAEISQTEKLKIEISLPSEDVYKIKLGQSVQISDGLEGKISLIEPAADPVTRKVRVEIAFNNENNDLIQGTFVDAVILTENNHTNPDSIFVPLKALTVSQNENFVMVNENGLAKKINVKIGQTQGSMVEMLEGLKDGDEVIVDGNKSLAEGDIVETY